MANPQQQMQSPGSGAYHLTTINGYLSLCYNIPRRSDRARQNVWWLLRVQNNGMSRRDQGIPGNNDDFNVNDYGQVREIQEP